MVNKEVMKSIMRETKKQGDEFERQLSMKLTEYKFSWKKKERIQTEGRVD